MNGGFLPLPPDHQGDTEIGVRQHVVGAVAQGGAKVDDGLIDFPLAAQSASQIALCKGEPRVDPDRLLVVGDRFLQPALSEQQESEIVVCVGIPGPDLEDSPVV